MNQNNNDDFFYECMPALEAEMLADLPDEQSLHHPFVSVKPPRGLNCGSGHETISQN